MRKGHFVALTYVIACVAACSAFRGMDSDGLSADAGADDALVAEGASGLDAGGGSTVDASAYVSEVMKDGPLVYYRLEENSGSIATATFGGPMGIIVGTPALAQAGKIGLAYGFDGVTQA